MLFNFLFLLVLAAVSAAAQTNPSAPTSISAGVYPKATQPAASPTNQSQTLVQHAEQIRADCIQNRRLICGRILKVFPNGLVVESGYTNLLREPLTKSWLVPGTVSADRAANLVEGREPGSICIGPVFLTDLPKSRGHKPKQYDYVILEGFPAGQFTYTSLGTIHRTVRRFSAQLNQAVDAHLEAEPKTPPKAAGVQ